MHIKYLIGFWKAALWLFLRLECITKILLSQSQHVWHLENVGQNDGTKVNMAEVIICHHLHVNISHRLKRECTHKTCFRSFWPSKKGKRRTKTERCEIRTSCLKTDLKCIEYIINRDQLLLNLNISWNYFYKIRIQTTLSDASNIENPH